MESITKRLRPPLALGALAGWRRTPSDHGIVLEMQVARNAEDFETRAFGKVVLSLNERQLRSLARDLTRALEERNIPLAAEKPLWKFW